MFLFLFSTTNVLTTFIFFFLCSVSSVRSIGSVALRKAENIEYRYHFDVFSINFNEELVALYGGSLQKQTQFVYISIKAILRLYKVRLESKLCFIKGVVPEFRKLNTL